MAVFSEQAPLSQYAIEPDYLNDNKLAWLGYKNDGSQSTWGKISSWIPGVGVGMNLAARGIANKNGAEDTLDMLKQDTDNRIMKTAVGAGVAMGGVGALGAAGALGAGSFGTFAANNALGLAKTGLGMSANFGGQLAFDQQEEADFGDYIYR